jgi:hypothetical protein
MKIWVLTYINYQTSYIIQQTFSVDEREQIISSLLEISEQTMWESMTKIIDEFITEKHSRYYINKSPHLINLELHDISGIC